jgi:hypothetical protein
MENQIMENSDGILRDNLRDPVMRNTSKFPGIISMDGNSELMQRKDSNWMIVSGIFFDASVRSLVNISV